jgi:hypothetical protein
VDASSKGSLDLLLKGGIEEILDNTWPCYVGIEYF